MKLAPGRSLMLTAAMGIVLDGPVRSINYNLEQIVNSLSCMYNEMSQLACHYQVQFTSILGGIEKIINGKYFFAMFLTEFLNSIKPLVYRVITRGGGQHIFSILSSGPSCPGFLSQLESLFFRENF